MSDLHVFAQQTAASLIAATLLFLTSVLTNGCKNSSLYKYQSSSTVNTIEESLNASLSPLLSDAPRPFLSFVVLQIVKFVIFAFLNIAVNFSIWPSLL